MAPLTIKGLSSGGIITNYFCTSACRHCLYGSSPSWEKRYMETDMAVAIFRKTRQLGCTSLHVGGGEPLLRPEALMEILQSARSEGIHIEYVETNSSWYRDHESACRLLTDLLARGVDTLLISIDPFHNEFIPFAKVKGVLAACRETGMEVFPWSMDFYRDLDSFDDSRTHELSEYSSRFGSHYLSSIPSRIWTHMGGRALELYKDLMPSATVEEILAGASPCRELADVSHFHFDCFGHYLPGLCSGFAIDMGDLGSSLEHETYPFISLLYSEGVGSLLKAAEADYSFKPRKTYASKCHLCFDIRRHIVLNSETPPPELSPQDFYLNT